MSEELKQRIRAAITDKTTANELIALIEAQQTKIAELTARVLDLETP